MLRRSFDGASMGVRRIFEGIQRFLPLFIQSLLPAQAQTSPVNPILVPGAPVLFSCMKRVKPMAYLAASAALAAAVLAGCARAQSQTSVTNPTVVPPPFTTAAMDKYQKPAAAELRSELTPMQFAVTQ